MFAEIYGNPRGRTARMPYNDFATAKNTVLNLVLNLVCIRPYQRYPGMYTAVLPGYETAVVLKYRPCVHTAVPS